MSQIDDLKKTLLRDLNTLRRELEAYGDESLIWKLPPGLKNSGGNLALHLLGNTRHFVGTILGSSGYVRNRDLEFSTKDLPRADITKQIDLAINEIRSALDHLDPQRLNSIYPIEVGGHRLTTGLFLTHLAIHFGYHLGQIDYHRRIVTGKSDPVGAMAISEIA